MSCVRDFLCFPILALLYHCRCVFLVVLSYCAIVFLSYRSIVFLPSCIMVVLLSGFLAVVPPMSYGILVLLSSCRFKVLYYCCIVGLSCGIGLLMPCCRLVVLSDCLLVLLCSRVLVLYYYMFSFALLVLSSVSLLTFLYSPLIMLLSSFLGLVCPSLFIVLSYSPLFISYIVLIYIIVFVSS